MWKNLERSEAVPSPRLSWRTARAKLPNHACAHQLQYLETM
jgi:hypothetical protein